MCILDIQFMNWLRLDDKTSVILLTINNELCWVPRLINTHSPIGCRSPDPYMRTLILLSNYGSVKICC